MRSVCKKYGALYILDEVMCGMGRESVLTCRSDLELRCIRVGMGTMHAWESFGDGEAPDIQGVAKGLGGG
jgi:E3 ubiquitin-protein ligase TRIP12